jgi:hypothetical protein
MRTRLWKRSCQAITAHYQPLLIQQTAVISDASGGPEHTTAETLLPLAAGVPSSAATIQINHAGCLIDGAMQLLWRKRANPHALTSTR